jgi:hypothetical protein
MMLMPGTLAEESSAHPADKAQPLRDEIEQAREHLGDVKLLYKPVSLLVSVLGGMLAAAVFKKVWKAAGQAKEEATPGKGA